MSKKDSSLSLTILIDSVLITEYLHRLQLLKGDKMNFCVLRNVSGFIASNY